MSIRVKVLALLLCVVIIGTSFPQSVKAAGIKLEPERPAPASTSNITSTDNVTSTSNITSSSNPTSSSNITSSSNTTSTSNVTATDNVTATVISTLSSNVTSTGIITATGNVTASGNVTLSSSITSSGNVTSSSNATVGVRVAFGTPLIRKQTFLVNPDGKVEIRPVSSNITTTRSVSANITSDNATSENITRNEVTIGDITLRFPKDVVATPMEVEFIERVPFGSTGMKVLRLFELNAQDSQSGTKVSQFNKDIEISIYHSPGELDGLDAGSLRLYYLDENTRQWMPVPSSYNSQRRVLTATVNHFTNFGEQASPLANGPGRVMATEVNMHSGSAVFSYPIELPPGPGGFQPKVELTYNSGSVDEMKNKRDMGSWVGIGWSLYLGRISYDLTTKLYTLDLNGGSYDLVSTNQTDYHTKPEQNFKINKSTNNTTWELLDREGIYYRFGGTIDSLQYVYDNVTLSTQNYRWDLSLMIDANNNTANVTYARDLISSNQTVRSAYPEYLKYGSNGTVEVHFTSSNTTTDTNGDPLRKDNPKSYGANDAPKIMENRQLDSIEVKFGNSLIRRYSFSYNTTESVYSNDYEGIYYSGNHTLSSITQYGSDNSTSLPPMVFSYQGLQTYRHTSEGDYVGNPGNPATFSWPHLTRISSGYGGDVFYSYIQLPDSVTNNIWTRQVVIDKTISSGTNNASSDSWWNASWGSRQKLTFNTSGTSSNLTDFPVLVHLTTSNFDFVSANTTGKDIRFIDSDNTTQLAYEIERWISNEAWVWVNVPQVSGNSTSDHIWLYYGNPAASDNQSPANVWDSNYVLVTHMKNKEGYPSKVTDSTSKQSDGTKTGANNPQETSGYFDQGQLFDGSIDKISITDNANGSLDITGGITIEAWAKVTNTSNYRPIVFKNDTGSGYNDPYMMRIETTGKVAGRIGNGNPNQPQENYISGNTGVVGAWHYSVFSYDSSNLHIYVDGASDATTPKTVDPLTNNTALSLGNWVTLWYLGILDEVRISNVARSPDWIKASYLSQSDSLISYGGIQKAGQLYESHTYSYTGNPMYQSSGWNQRYRGFNEVMETDAEGNYIKHRFYTTGVTNGRNADKLTGKEYKTEWYNADGTLIRDKTYYWLVNDGSTWWNTAWNSRQKLTFNTDNVSSNLTGFPVLVHLTNSNFDFSTTKSAGQDIRFVDADNTTELNYEIESWNAGTSEAWVWVRVPTLSGNSSSDYIWMYYGNPYASDSQNSAGVWDSNYKMVHHLEETDIDGSSGAIKDSTSYTNNGTTSGMDTYDHVAGKVDGSFDFDGSNDYVDVGNGAPFPDITVEAWIRYPSSNSGEIVSKHFGLYMGYAFRLNGDGTLTWYPGDGTSWNALTSTVALATNTWYYVVAASNDSYRKIYIDSIERGSGAGVSSLAYSPLNLRIGAHPTGTLYFNGMIDEVRISNTARSTDWIKATYLSESGSLITYGNPESYDQSADWRYTAWNSRQKLTFDTTSISSNLTDFPVLVHLTNSNFDFNSAKPAGQDIRFIDADNTTILNHEIESWNGTTSEAWVWVKVPQLSGNSTSDYIWMYYGNPSVGDSQNATGVWETNYKVVQHLEETDIDGGSGDIKDSTSNGKNGTSSGMNSNNQFTGNINGSFYFDGSDDYVDIGNLGARPTSGTISFWINAIVFENYRNPFTTGIVDSGTGYGNRAIRFEENSDGTFLAFLGSDTADGGSGFTGHSFGSGLSASTWYHVVLVWDSSGNNVKGYLDGIQKFNESNTTWPTTFNNVNIGRGWSTTRYFKGLLDEVRISEVARSADWIKASYLSQTDSLIGYGSWAVQLTGTDETVGTKTRSIRYDYDNYGNIITEYQYGDIADNTDNVTIHRSYSVNTTANILSKVARERTYANTVVIDDGGINLRKETLYYYDDATSYQTPPSKGDLTSIVHKSDNATSVSTIFTYDVWGNKTSDQDPNGYTTNWSYETTYHTYPQTRTLPVSVLSENYTYDIGTTNLLGLTDANNQTTNYYYDGLKRLTGVVKPGDSVASASVNYTYSNWGTVNQQHIKTTTKVSNDESLWQKEYFDGLGRVVQIQSVGEPSFGADNRTIISSTVIYNNRGQVERQYVSQDLLASNVSGYRVPDSGWKYISYQYDGLGRVTVQTNADGSTTSRDYSTGWQELVTNERGYKKRYYYDAFRRLSMVRVLYDDHATTSYSYDALGNLVKVIDAASNNTTMTYDWLSRKTAMTDPDMGSWSYGYDNNGNTVNQTDAKGQTITFTYDKMNRLTGKSYPASANMTNVTYAYDNLTDGGSYAKGKRISMTDALFITRYRYDERGRIISENRTLISDSISYVTQFGYDGADRNTWILYPTGENVTQTYNGRGLPYSLSGGTVGNLVTKTLYNQLGSPTDINLGNSVNTTFGYWGVGGSHDTAGGYYGKLWEIKTISPVNTLQDTQHTWDAGGNMLNRYNVLTSNNETFDYDFLDRLTSVSGNYTDSWTYRDVGQSDIGNIVSHNGTPYLYGSSRPHAMTRDVVWTSPTGNYSDNESAWQDEANAYDDQWWSTAAIYNLPIGSWTPFIYLTHDPIEVDVIRYSVAVLPTPPIVDIDVYDNVTATWVDVYEGSFGQYPRATINLVNLDQKRTVTKARIRLTSNNSDYNFYAWIYEFDFGLYGEHNYTYDTNGNMITKGSDSLTWDVENRLVAITGGNITGSWWNTAWNSRQKLTFNTSDISSNLTGFPVLVHLTTNNFDFTSANTTGKDIRFVDSDNTTTLDYEIESWNGTANEAWIWVRVPTLSGNFNNDYMWLYYGNASASDNQSPANVWESSYKMVQHLGEASGTLYDSTSNNNDGAQTGGVTYGVAGRIGNAVRFDGNNDYISVSDADSLDVNDYTISLWVKYNGTGTAGKAAWTLIGKNPTFIGYNDPFHLYVAAGSTTITARVGNETAEVYAASNKNIDDGNRHYITLTRSGSTITLYTDGTANATATITGYTTNAGALTLGVWPMYSNYFNGEIDEVRISNTTKSADWIKASYLSETDNLITYTSKENSTFVYDGDGKRVQKTEGGETILYINKYYEKNLTTGENTTYYYLGDKLVAKRTGTTLNYIHQDHLGGTVLVTSDNGTLVGSTSYDPMGGTRTSTGDLGTDKLFTGQRLDQTGLYDYKARYYDPEIGRFISADTVVPNPSNPQALNRYSYVVNNPLRYNDPTGHGWGYDEDDNIIWIPDEPSEDGDDEDGDDSSDDDGTGGPSLPLGSSEPLIAQEPKPSTPEFNWGPVATGGTITAVLIGDDATVVGALNDVLVILVWLGTGVALVVENKEYIQYQSYSIGEKISNTLDVAILWFAEHDKNKSPSNKEKHEKGQERKLRDKPGGEKGDARRTPRK